MSAADWRIAEMIQQATGGFARDYNRRKRCSGAFWQGRYHATMVDSGEYLWEGLRYVELNMVRCRALNHPGEWAWSGYGAVGDRAYVDAIEQQVRSRPQMRVDGQGDSWTLREEHGACSALGKSSLTLFEPSFPL
jgi:hypothetical protein